MGRHDALNLGKPLGECTIVQNRKAHTVVNEFEDGWTLVAARVGADPRYRFHCLVHRCHLDGCKRRGCLGHEKAVTRLATTIRSTYQ